MRNGIYVPWALFQSGWTLFLETVDAAEDMKLNFMAVAEMFLANSITEQHSDSTKQCVIFMKNVFNVL